MAIVLLLVGLVSGSRSSVEAAEQSADSFAFRLFGGADDPGRLAQVDVSRYRLFLLSPYMRKIAAAVKEARADALVYVYKDASSARRDLSRPASEWCNADGGTIGRDWGVDYCDAVANHPKWFLTVHGDRFEYAGYRSHWHADVGAPDYKERWTANVLAELHGSPAFDGVFVDNQLTKIGAYTPGGVAPDQYADDRAGQAAYQSFIDYAGSQLRNAGFGVLANMADARLFAGLWDRYSAQQSGGFDEFWTTFGGTETEPDNLPAYEPSGWQVQLAEVETAAATGKLGVFSAQTSGGRCTECARYGYAGFLLADDGTQVFMESNVDAVVGDWVASRDMYDWQLGKPTGRRTQLEPNLHQRAFEHGLVLVNSDPDTSRRVTLPMPYRDESGRSVTTVDLPARRARILRT
ncbi:putative glycoside hydrolase family 15 protein [Kribbella sp. NBC_01505]|uniref:putative glycoside hydrolase n=1 Tax=Kribbella sp. NBC_01505 TaxID=2903580 RepID=UPI00386E0051